MLACITRLTTSLTTNAWLVELFHERYKIDGALHYAQANKPLDN